MKLVFLSDTHSQLDKVKIPEGDILFHSGDLTYSGSIKEIASELNKLKKLSYKHKVIICGNHDWLGERNPLLMKQMCNDSNIIYLDHESVTIDGLQIFGSAYTPEFYNWAFNLPRGEYLKNKWDSIPINTNILITHGPPYSILDKCPDGRLVGCEELYKKVISLKDLVIHSFGHIHHSYGQYMLDKKRFINSSICTELYKPNNQPIVIDIKTN